METIFQDASNLPDHMAPVSEIMPIQHAQSFYMVGVCRSGVLTANNYAALRDVAVHMESTMPDNKEVIFAPIPEIPVAKYLQNLIHGLDHVDEAGRDRIANSMIGMYSEATNWRSKSGRLALEVQASSVTINIGRWQQGMQSIFAEVGMTEMGMAAAASSEMFGSADGEANMADLFAAMDETMTNIWLRNNGITRVSARTDMPSQMNHPNRSGQSDEQQSDILRTVISTDGGVAPKIVRFSDNLINMANAAFMTGEGQAEAGEGKTRKQIASVIEKMTVIKQDKFSSQTFERLYRSLSPKLNDELILSAFEMVLADMGEDRSEVIVRLKGMNVKDVRELSRDFVTQIVVNAVSLEDYLSITNKLHKRAISAVDHYEYMLVASQRNGRAVLRQNFSGTARDEDPFNTAINRVITRERIAPVGGKVKLVGVITPNEDHWQSVKDQSPVKMFI